MKPTHLNGKRKRLVKQLHKTYLNIYCLCLSIASRTESFELQAKSKDKTHIVRRINTYYIKVGMRYKNNHGYRYPTVDVKVKMIEKKIKVKVRNEKYKKNMNENKIK